jgi:predicted DNA-binding transcriptional regulator YafY
MKITMSPQAARKVLTRLEAETDRDVRGIVERIEQALQPGVMLTSDELHAVLQALRLVVQGRPAASSDDVERAIPKLEYMLAKTQAREDDGGRR